MSAMSHSYAPASVSEDLGFEPIQPASPNRRRRQGGGEGTGADAGTPDLQRGDTGNGVRRLQSGLNGQGHALNVDGIFGPLTETAVKAFESLKGLTPDGRVDAEFWQRLSGGGVDGGGGSDGGVGGGVGPGVDGPDVGGPVVDGGRTPQDLDPGIGGRGAEVEADESSTDSVARLKAVSEGDWIGDVDEVEALSIIDGLSTADAARAAADHVLMQNLADAFNAEEMVRALTKLNPALKWKIWWCEKAGEMGSVAPTAVLSWVSGANFQQTEELAGWREMWDLAYSVLTDAGLWGNAVLANPNLNAAWMHTVEADLMVIALPIIPRGDAMPIVTRQRLYELSAWMTLDQIRVCFEHRFLHRLEDTTGGWTTQYARLVWENLDQLPDGHVTQNTILTTFQAISGTGAFGPSWESPGTVNTIQIGVDHNPAQMAHTVRHEVGHAVHAEPAYMGSVNSWLQNEVGFWFFPPGEPGLKSWVDELGGLGAMSTSDQDRFIELLDSYVGSGSSWVPARTTFTDGLTPEDTAIHDAAPDAVRSAITQSPSYWYNNYANFAPGSRGKYFLNYWYQRGFYMSATAEQCVAASGDNYTAMSEKEFFANCYAEFFKDPAGFTDNTKWGGSLPGSVQTFFRNVILDRQPYTPPAAADTTPAVDDSGPAAPSQAPPQATGMSGTP